MIEYEPIFHSREDLTNVHVSCSCGEWEFQGDWDDMCSSWFEHERDPSHEYLYVTKDNHKGVSFITREGSIKLQEMLDERRARMARE